jgi:hypothetical protein
LQRRQERALLASVSNNSSNNNGRASSAKAVRDKRCCGLCLQSACVGDCPEKRPRLPAGRCDKCFQPLCTGACQDSRYDQRMRSPRSSDNLVLEDRPPPPPPRPPSRGCHSCARRHNAKLLNANCLLLGRPKSLLVTYSRGKASTRPPRDLRPASATTLHSSLIKDFEKLGIEPQQPAPPKAAQPSRPRSRHALMPGKSSRSQRKASISDQPARKKRARSARSARALNHTS